MAILLNWQGHCNSKDVIIGFYVKFANQLSPIISLKEKILQQLEETLPLAFKHLKFDLICHAKTSTHIKNRKRLNKLNLLEKEECDKVTSSCKLCY